MAQMAVRGALAGCRLIVLRRRGCNNPPAVPLEVPRPHSNASRLLFIVVVIVTVNVIARPQRGRQPPPVARAAEAGFNLIYVQVRGYADAFYSSAHEPWSALSLELGGTGGVVVRRRLG